MFGILYWNGDVSIRGMRGEGTGVERNVWKDGSGFSSASGEDSGSRSSRMQCDVSYGSEAEYVAEMVKQSFHRCVYCALVLCVKTHWFVLWYTILCSKPKETASAILDSITDIDRIHLLLALQSKASKANIEVRDREYIDDLVKSIRKSEAHQHLSRGEIANALAYQKMLQRYNSHSNQPPSWKQLSGVMLAAGLPFVGYVLCCCMSEKRIPYKSIIHVQIWIHR